MKPTDKSDRISPELRTRLGLALLACIALALRVGLTLALSRSHVEPVTYEHGEIAENLLAGRGFAVTYLGQWGLTSQQAPLYPASLAAVYWLFGTATPAALLAMQLIQCMAGTAIVVCVVWLSWSLLPDKPAIGWIAGLGAAVYPTHVYMVTHIQVAVWAALVLTLLAAVVTSPRLRGSLSGAVLSGVLAGILLLIEPILALSLPILAVVSWLAATERNRCSHRAITSIREPRSWLAAIRPAALAPPLLFAGVTILVVAPWLWRNYRVHGELVFVKSTFGYAFWQGNNPISWGTDKVPKPSVAILRQEHDGSLAGREQALWAARHETLYIDDVLLKPSGYHQFAGLTEPARSRLLGAEASRFIREHPTRYATLCWQRLRYFLLFDETNPKTADPIYRTATLIWVSLAAAGLWLSRRDGRRLWPSWAVFAVIMLFHALTITSARFRIPLEPMTFTWCAWAVATIASRVKSAATARARFPGVAAEPHPSPSAAA